MRLKSATLVVAGLVAGLLAAACGSRGPTAITVTTREYTFDEGTWTVPAGQAVDITFKNEGTLEHEWVIVNQGQSITVPFDDDDEAKVFWEIEGQPGETATATFTAPATAGTYTIVCGVPGHLEAGMQATLTVK